MRRRKASALRGVAMVLAAIVIVTVIGVVLFLAFFDWNALRGPVARFVSARIERPVALSYLDVRVFSSSPRVEIRGLTIGNPQWAGGGNMVDVGRIAVEYKFWPLLIGNLVVVRADVDKPVVSLMRDSSGRANWQFGNKEPRTVDAEPIDLPVIRDFSLRDGRIEVKDKLRKLSFGGTVTAGESLSRAEKYPFRMVGKGLLNGKRFDLVVRGGPLVNVRRDKPYPFDADVRAGATRLYAQGSIDKPFNLGRLEVALTASGDDLADVYYLTGLALPNTPPYKVSGHLQRKGTLFGIGDFNGRIGDSDVSGDLAVETAGGRPHLKARLVSQSLDLDDLAAPLGAAPQSKGDETISPAQRQLGRAMAAQGRLFPDARLQVERVRGMDADVKFEAKAIKARKIPMKQVAFDLRLKDGVLHADPVSFVLPQGRFTGSVHLDAGRQVPQSAIDFRVTDVQLGQFKPRDGQPPLEGRLLGRIRMEGAGDSVLKVVSSGNGSVTAIVPSGEVREAFAELTGINVARGLGLLLTKDQQQVKVRCGVADFELRDGDLSVKNLVFDTENVLITGKGKIDLDSETADLTIKGQPKKLRLLRVRAPISIKGPLRKPNIGIEGEKTVEQGAVAAALAAIAAPIAAVIAFVDPGLAKDADCAALLAEAQQHGRESVPAAQTAGR